MDVAVMTTSQGVYNPHLSKQARIEGLPDDLVVVPEDPVSWAKWRIRVSAHREKVRRMLVDDPDKWSPIQNELCARSTNYWITMFGAIFEPRDVEGPPGWRRWIPFAFQVKMIDWIHHVMQQDELGRGDGVVEKSREMGASWLFCAFMAHQFIYADIFVAGIISRSEEAVEKVGDTDTLFYKVRSLLGLEDAVPENIRLPQCMMPKGFNRDDHSFKRLITHPYKTCVIKGETTTELSGVGGRSTMRLNDEAARFSDFRQAWSNQAATTTHRFAVSSADTRSPAFYDLARRGEQCLQDDKMAGPSFLRLDWHIHPLHTQKWYENEKGRMIDDPAGFEREYNINYFAGQGNTVYPRFLQMIAGDFPYDPRLGQVYCFIDPGLSDATALIWVQEDPVTQRYRVFDSFQGVRGEPAEFYASILVGIPISGYGGYEYDYYYDLDEKMAFFANLKRKIIYYGDPYGNNRGGDGKKSFYEGLRDASRRLTNGSNTIFVQYTYTAPGLDGNEKKVGHRLRKEKVNEMAGKIDFNKTPGGMAVLTALQRSKYPDQKDGQVRTTEQEAPEHDDHSHLRTAWEFGMINIAKLQDLGKSARPKDGRSRRMKR